MLTDVMTCLQCLELLRERVAVADALRLVEQLWDVIAQSTPRPCLAQLQQAIDTGVLAGLAALCAQVQEERDVQQVAVHVSDEM